MKCAEKFYQDVKKYRKRGMSMMGVVRWSGYMSMMGVVRWSGYMSMMGVERMRAEGLKG